MARLFFVFGAVFAMLGVAAGAFGAHALKVSLSAEMLAVFETAVRYQMYHAFGLFVVGWALTQADHPGFRSAGWLFVGGILLFSGSLYLLSFSGVRWLGAVTPLGGIALLAGWGLLAWGFWRQ